MIIQPLLLITALGLFSTKYSHLNYLFIHAQKRLFTFAYRTQANTVYNYVRDLVNYFHRLTHIYLFALSFVLRVDCLTFFPFKDRIPFALRSHVVYKYKCQCCGALYVGQTRRHIHTRISEHMGVSPKTGNKLSVSQMSAVLTHHRFSKHTISDSDFTILTSSNSKFDLEMRESLLISKFKPILNNNISSTPLYLF